MARKAPSNESWKGVEMSKVSQHEPEGFSAFWDIWRPHRRKNDGRGDARERYRKCLLAGANPERIAAGAAWYIRTMKNEERPYIPLAATWLHREAYEDCADDKAAYEASKAKSEADAAANVTKFPTGQTSFLKKFNAQKAANG